MALQNENLIGQFVQRLADFRVRIEIGARPLAQESVKTVG